jgi:mannobiose 2-epimerase
MIQPRRLFRASIGLALAALAAQGCCAGPRGHAATATSATAAAPPPEAALERRLDGLRARLASLGEETFEFWRTHGPDPVWGGFYGTVDRTGKKAVPTDKGLIQTARHLWAMSMWYQRKKPTLEVKALADSLYRFLIGHFYDPATKEFFLTVTESGAPVEPRKVLAGQALAIYGLTQYARAFGVVEAAGYAMATFQALDARAHDDAFGGYRQINDAPWLPATTEKETNTQVHLLEAFTALYDYGHHPAVRARLQELVTICIDRLLQPSGYLHRDFRLDWSLVGEPAVSYGHDMETGWLLLEAARALGRPDDPRIVAAAKIMIIGPARTGYDPVKGGYFEEGPPGGGPPTKLAKIWWVQAEALLALWTAFRLTHDPGMLDRFDGTLRFIETTQRDPAHGEWFWSVLPDGTPGEKADEKGNAWKASYHTLRALTFSEQWIATARSRSATPR